MEELNPKQGKEILDGQRHFFFQGKTREMQFRIESLKALKSAIKASEGEILQALLEDMGKGAFEAYSTEVGFVLKTIGDTIGSLKKWPSLRELVPLFISFPPGAIFTRSPMGWC